MGQDLCFEKIVEASTPKFGEWAERWDSHEPLTLPENPSNFLLTYADGRKLKFHRKIHLTFCLHMPMEAKS